jgi:Na+-transporting NADH:ubiquinone oxidoreductase subunit NqrB
MEAGMTIDAEELQKLVTRLNDLTGRADTSKNEAETSATEVQSLANGALKEIDLDGSGSVDSAKWAALSPEIRQTRYDRLLRVVEAVGVLEDSDGPTDRNSIMFRDYLGNGWVVFLTLLALVGTMLTLFFIHQNFHQAIEGPAVQTSQQQVTPALGTAPAPEHQPPLEENVLLMVMLMGILGGFLHLTSSLAIYVGNRHLLRSWVIYYLLMPVEGAALAVALYLLLRVGVLSPSNPSQASTANLNFVGIYGFSVLAGIFSKQALEMLANVFNIVFAKVKAKDAVGAPSDNTAPAPAAAKQPASGD